MPLLSRYPQPSWSICPWRVALLERDTEMQGPGLEIAAAMGLGLGLELLGFKGCTNTAGDSGTKDLGASKTAPRPTAAPCSSRGCSRRSRSSDTGTSHHLSAWTSCGTSHTTVWSTGARTRRVWRRPAASSSNGSPSCAGGHGAGGVGVLVAGQPGPTLSPTCP